MRFWQKFARCRFSIETVRGPPVCILITGANGQLGSHLVPYLASRLPCGSQIIRTDIDEPNGLSSSLQKARASRESIGGVTVLDSYLDVLDEHQVEKIIIEKNVQIVIHFAAMLSAIGEKHPEKALALNVHSVHKLLNLASRHKLRIFVPSTIGAFGPSTPRHDTPDITIMRPTTIYGISKLHMELLGEWYHGREGVDFRSLRLPGVLSFMTAPGGGTTDYAIHMILAAVAQQAAAAEAKAPYSCFLKEDTRLPMLHIDDTMEGIVKLLFAPPEQLGQRVYNINAMDFTPKELEVVLRRKFPAFLPVSYRPDFRQAIADSWPASLNDAAARRDWGWAPKIHLDAMLDNVKSSLN